MWRPILFKLCILLDTSVAYILFDTSVHLIWCDADGMIE